jgi:hypothetical protein
MTTLDPGATGRRPEPSAALDRRRQKRNRKKKRSRRAEDRKPREVRDPAADSPLMTIPAAGKKYYGLSRNGSYVAAERGDFGKLYSVGRRQYVVIAAVEAKIQAAVA